MRGLTTALALLLAGSVLLLGACSRESDEGRVILLGIDGLDPEVIDLLISEGSLPNFAHLRRQGAYAPLFSPPPLLSPILWTTIATGRGPEDHGIGHFTALDPATGEPLPVTSRMRRVAALWNIVSAAERRAGVVGWWASWPPEPVRGFVVSDRVAYHFLFGQGLRGAEEEGARTHPPELFERIRPWLRRPESLGAEELARYLTVAPGELAAEVDFDDPVVHFRWALATLESYEHIGLELWRAERPDLLMVFIEGTDSTSHLFGHLFRASGLAGELAEQQERYGRAVEEIYKRADELVGRYLEAMDERTTLVVLSDHGFELGALPEDPSKLRDMRRVSERHHRPYGILYLYGRGVAPRSRLSQPHLLDVAPTVLALLGIPPSREMPGRVLGEGLRLPGEPQRIASWEGVTGPHRIAWGSEEAPAPAADPAQEEILARLRSLGYLGDSGAVEASPGGDRNLAAIHFQAGRLAEAEAAYRRLVEADPDDGSARASLAGVLGSQGRYDEAMQHLDRAIELEPLNVEAYHNRAVILERRGDLAAAIADYRRAVRYDPQYLPSREALLRLGESPAASAPATEAERAALAMAEDASGLARRGDYAGAMRRLEEAERLAPRYALVHQYRANVAYLMGDREAAIAALERGLELEPDNALFRANLDRLRRQP